MSPAQLLWHTRRMKLREVQRDQRTLLLIAAGTAGGESGKKLARSMDREERRLAGRAATREVDPDESQIPRSQAEFEAMLKEDEQDASS